MNNLAVTQNFLTDPTLVNKLIKQTNITEDDHVIDIGAGKGIITQELNNKCKKVTAIEYDPALFNQLKLQFSQSKNVELLNLDILKYVVPSDDYKVFSNIPFNITSKIVNKFLFNKNPPRSLYLITQDDAANRFLGVGEGYLISNLLQPFFNMRISYKFLKTDFIPQPSVNVVLFAVETKKVPLVSHEQKMDYWDFVAYVCLQQKPSLKNRLTKIFTYEQLKRIEKDLNLSMSVTVKELDVNKWVKLYEVYAKYVPSEKKSPVIGSYSVYKKLQEKSPIGSRTKIRL